MRPRPDVDVEKCASEVKAYLQREKYNLIDSDSREIEAWVPPDDPETPELCRLREQHEEFFAYASGLDIKDDGTGYPTDLAQEFRDVVGAIAGEVNRDGEYWDVLRAEVLPLYGKIRVTRQPDGTMSFASLDDGKKKNPWAKRWKSVELFYDPMPIGVKSTMRLKNRRGEVKEGSEKVVTDKVIPAGFVIRVI